MTAVPLIVILPGHAVQDDAPSAEYVLPEQTGHVLPDLYEPATHVPTLHRPVTLLFDEFHVCVPHVLRFVIAEHAVEQVLSALVLNAVPVPDVVLPAGHAVHVDEPAELYDPVAHAVWVVAPAAL